MTFVKETYNIINLHFLACNSKIITKENQSNRKSLSKCDCLFISFLSICTN